MDFTLQNIMKNQKKKSTEKNNSVDDLFWVVSKSDSATNSDLNLKNIKLLSFHKKILF